MKTPVLQPQQNYLTKQDSIFRAHPPPQMQGSQPPPQPARNGVGGDDGSEHISVEAGNQYLSTLQEEEGDEAADAAAYRPVVSDAQIQVLSKNVNRLNFPVEIKERAPQ